MLDNHVGKTTRRWDVRQELLQRDQPPADAPNPTARTALEVRTAIPWLGSWFMPDYRGTAARGLLRGLTKPFSAHAAKAASHLCTLADRNNAPSPATLRPKLL